MRYLNAKFERIHFKTFTQITGVQISTYFGTKCAGLVYRMCCTYKPLLPSSYRKTCGCPLYNFNYAK